MAALSRKRRRLLLQKKRILLQKWLLLIQKRDNKKSYRRKRWWVHPDCQQRKTEGAFHTLMETMSSKDPTYFKCCLEMPPEAFNMLVDMVKDKLEMHNHGREAISPAQRIAVTIWFLVSGNSFASIAHEFRLGTTTVANIVKHTCNAIWNTLQETYLPTPSLTKWQEIADSYGTIWQFPFCSGAVVWKHIVIEPPDNGGSQCHNYKQSHSINLMAVVDAMYRFVAVDIAGYGSDENAFKSFSIRQVLESNTLSLPPEQNLPRSQLKVPHVLIGDEAFQLRQDFMRPFSAEDLDSERRVFNYRLTHARRCTENAFGIMTAKFRVFKRPITLKPENVDPIVKACVVLHNYLLIEESKFESHDRAYCPPGFSDSMDNCGTLQEGQWRSYKQSTCLRDLRSTSARNQSVAATNVRLTYMRYFNSEEGAVPWQWLQPGVTQPEASTEATTKT